jgi:L-seryl-tRNA(Ser) seleniumtransferase
MTGDRRGQLPAVTALLDLADVQEAVRRHGHGPVVANIRDVLAGARAALDGAVASGPSSSAVPDAATLAALALAALERRMRATLRPVINATGVLLHTNLGRAPLSARAIEHAAAAGGTTNLEIDLDTGRRGGRERAARDALVRLTGAEAALLVNNCAAALMLTLHAHAQGQPVAISRGELVEIGGSFRIPEIVAASGARLMEVGTTNRTHADDYREAVAAGARAILRVHPSNYRVEGFTAQATDAELARIARDAGVPFIHDVGSGMLPGAATFLTSHLPELRDEPRVDEAARLADLVVFSGDKLLGGPQVGVIVGRADLVEVCARAPFARALRIDKLHLAAMEATLSSHERGELAELPLFAMASVPTGTLQERAAAIAGRCGGTPVAMEAVLGGGSLPGLSIASYGIALPGDAEVTARRLRTGDPAVIGRIEDARLLLDLRTVPQEHDELLVAAVLRAGADGH